MSAMLLPGNLKVGVAPEDLVKVSQLVQNLEGDTETHGNLMNPQIFIIESRLKYSLEHFYCKLFSFP
jgi:hypothetical protein